MTIERLPAARALLRFGYSLEWREEDGARVCLVADPDESFEGRGADEQAALEDALRRIAPSKIARALIDREGARQSDEASSERMVAEALVPGGPGAPRDLRSILADLQLVAARVEAGIPEAALMAPPLQKLHVLAWIARARTLEHEAGRARSASDACGAIARRLTVLCKTWWPGSVRALQLDATPDRASREQGLAPASRWLDVALAAEARLEELIAEPPSDDGWRDSAVLSPAPEDGATEIAFAVKTIERLIAPLRSAPTHDGPRPLTRDEELQLEDAATRLRWSRPVAPDPEEWGAAIGRLRWVVAHKRGGPRLPRLLDPTHIARPSWANEAHAARSRLVALGTPPDGEKEILSWLTTVFDAIDTPALAQRIRDARTLSGAAAAPKILAIQEANLPANDRRLRRRLRQLQALLGSTMAGEPAAAAPDSGTLPLITPDPEESAVRSTHDERIFELVKRKLPTASTLFVSNREDPMLKDRLVKALGWEIEWTTAEPRRIASIAGAIGRGKYKVVLSATGFQDHSTDIALARAAAASGTLYVRVNRGRSAACARALARELGIRPEEMSPIAEERGAGAA